MGPLQKCIFIYVLLMSHSKGSGQLRAQRRIPMAALRGASSGEWTAESIRTRCHSLFNFGDMIMGTGEPWSGETQGGWGVS